MQLGENQFGRMNQQLYNAKSLENVWHLWSKEMVRWIDPSGPKLIFCV